MRTMKVVLCASAGLALAISNLGPFRAVAQDDTQARPGGSSIQAGGRSGYWYSNPVQDDTRARPGGNSMNAGRGNYGYFRPAQDDTQARPGGNSMVDGPAATYQPYRYVQQQPQTRPAPMNNEQGQTVKTREHTIHGQGGTENGAFLGIDLEPRGQGAVVKRVYADTAAAEVGLMPGDVIRSVNGQAIRSARELTNWVSKMEPGQQVTIQFDRPTTVQTTIKTAQPETD